MSEKVTKLIEDVKSLTVLELSELVKALEEEFGVSAAAPVAVAAAPAAGGAAGAAEEKTEFDVILASAGAEKSRLSRLFVKSQALALKTKTWLTVLQSRLKKALTKQLTKSKLNLKKLAHKLKLNNLRIFVHCYSQICKRNYIYLSRWLYATLIFYSLYKLADSLKSLFSAIPLYRTFTCAFSFYTLWFGYRDL